MGLPVLRTLSLCTCCRHYPGAAAGRLFSLGNPAVSAFPERVIGSACASSFSRLARRSLALRPAHSRCHQFVTRIPKASASSLPPWLLRLLLAGAVAGWDLHPLESAALSRRTPPADFNAKLPGRACPPIRPPPLHKPHRGGSASLQLHRRVERRPVGREPSSAISSRTRTPPCRSMLQSNRASGMRQRGRPRSRNRDGTGRTCKTSPSADPNLEKF